MAKGKKSPRKSLKKSPVKVTKKQILEQKRLEKAEIEDKERNFNENLIVAVYSRGYIYDRDDPNHDRKKMISKAWNEISGEVGRPVSACHTRWRSLRDTFKRKYADWKSSQSGDGQDDSTNKPTWPWFDSLLFLKDCNIPEKTIDSLQLSETMEVPDEDLGESDSASAVTN